MGVFFSRELEETCKIAAFTRLLAALGLESLKTAVLECITLIFEGSFSAAWTALGALWELFARKIVFANPFCLLPFTLLVVTIYAAINKCSDWEAFFIIMTNKVYASYMEYKKDVIGEMTFAHQVAEAVVLMIGRVACSFVFEFVKLLIVSPMQCVLNFVSWLGTTVGNLLFPKSTDFQRMANRLGKPKRQ